MLINIHQKARRYLALLMLALAALLAQPLQAQHDHRGPASHAQETTVDAHCPQHAVTPSQPEPPSTHTDHSCQCLAACASAAVAIATTAVPPPLFMASPPRCSFHAAPLPFSAPVPPYRPPIHTASV
ncbi:MAG: hypothetical protein ABW049_06070 [Spongiibacteraceae bacterium]